jgi:arabinofuranosyltransferase
MAMFDTAFFRKHGLFCAGLLFFLFIFFKNAWVADDAYISFRSIEQVFAGHGPRWNIDERVQVYTSPLWFGLLLMVRLLSSNLFLDAILLSAVCCVGMLWFARRLIADDARFTAFVLLLTGTWCVMDFSSSGLENPLLYLLLSAFVFFYSAFFRATETHERMRYYQQMMTVFGLLAVARHDAVTLVGIPALAAMVCCWHTHGTRAALVSALCALLPLVCWTIFAVIYYGVPFPNTAYAKMLHGIPRSDLIDFGMLYLDVSLKFDLFSQIILGALVLRLLWQREPAVLFLVLGVVLNFSYILYVGGDFMQGRFISEAIVLAALALCVPPSLVHSSITAVFSEKTQVFAAVIVLLVLMLLTASPLKLAPDSGFDLEEGHRHYSWHGILNERNFYFKTNSLWAYLHRDRDAPFPDHKWCRMGINAREENKQASDFGGIGMYGYCAGLDLIVIDNLALGEPFLARLPMSQTREWRAGHYHRDLPQGYYESRVTRQNHLQEPHLALLWEDIAQLDHEPLFTRARWQAIWRVNTGYYKNIGDYYFADLDSLDKTQKNP